MAAEQECHSTWEIRWWFPTAGVPREVLGRFDDWTGDERLDRYPVLMLGPGCNVKLRDGAAPERKERRAVLEAGGVELERWEKCDLDDDVDLADRPDLVTVDKRVARRSFGGGHLEVGSVRLLDRHGWTMAVEVPADTDPLAVVAALDDGLPGWREWAQRALAASYPRYILRVCSGARTPQAVA
jgi:hypothetical protein